MKVVFIEKYNEIMCDLCGDYDWGKFVKTDSEYINSKSICHNCYNSLIIAVRTDDLINGKN